MDRNEAVSEVTKLLMEATKLIIEHEILVPEEDTYIETTTICKCGRFITTLLSVE